MPANSTQESLDKVLPVMEKFTSINGEGRNAGKLAAFIRMRGCNLSCSYCDTRWANDQCAPAVETTIGDLCGWVADCGVKYVTLTGGEPLLHPESSLLAEALLESQMGSRTDLVVEIETNGSIALDNLARLRMVKGWGSRLQFTMDWKLPGSGMTDRMREENLELLGANDVLKCVVSDKDDLQCVLRLIRNRDLDRQTQVYLSPVFGAIEPVSLVEFMKNNDLTDVTLQMQLHKLIWRPDERGV